MNMLEAIAILEAADLSQPTAQNFALRDIQERITSMQKNLASLFKESLEEIEVSDFLEKVLTQLQNQQ